MYEWEDISKFLMAGFRVGLRAHLTGKLRVKVLTTKFHLRKTPQAGKEHCPIGEIDTRIA